MWVIEPYFVWVAVSDTLFWVSVCYFKWVGGGWGILLGGLEWVGVYEVLFIYNNNVNKKQNHSVPMTIYSAVEEKSNLKSWSLTITDAKKFNNQVVWIIGKKLNINQQWNINQTEIQRIFDFFYVIHSCLQNNFIFVFIKSWVTIKK